MSDADDIAEINRLREIEEINQLRANDPYIKAKEGLEGLGGVLAKGVNAATRTVDKYVQAPIRAAVGAAQNDQPVGKAFANQFLREPETAPTGKQIMAKAGLSEEEFNTPLISNPFTGQHFRTSPAGLAGGLAETALDPLTYIPGELAAKSAAKGAEIVAKVAPRAGQAAARFAEERAVKAATGENRRAIKNLARVKGQSGSDVDRAMGNLRQAGRTLLSEDDAGPAAVGWLSNSESIGREALAKKNFYGKQIGKVGETVDRLTPDAMTGADLATDLRQYSSSIPNVGKGSVLKKRLEDEAKNLDEMGPISFKQAQEIKAQFPYEPQAADALISDKDVTNRIHGIIGGRMDTAAEKAKAPVELGGIISPRSEEELAALSAYDPAKKKYGVYKNVADAGAEQSMRTLGRRLVSPSSNAAAIGTGIATAGEGFKKAGLAGAAAGLANQIALSRGSAFAARASDAISKKLMAAPGVYQKWLPTIQNAARAGDAAVVATHKQLMANDPVYYRLMTEEP